MSGLPGWLVSSRTWHAETIIRRSQPAIKRLLPLALDFAAVPSVPPANHAKFHGPQKAAARVPRFRAAT